MSTVTHIRRGLLGVLAATLVLTGAAPAHAQLKVDLTIAGAGDDADAEEGAKKADPKVPPTFRAVVSGVRPGLLDKDFTLKQVDADPPVLAKATKVLTYPESDQPMALVVLVQGNEDWMGNDTYRGEDDSERLLGAYRGVGPALDALAKMGPPGSQAALLAYGDTVKTVHPMGPLNDFGSSALGSQQGFVDIGASFETGLNEAYSLLAKQGDRRKILVVIGDGQGSTDNSAKDIKDTAKKLEDLGVELYSIYHLVNQALDANTGLRNMKEVGDDGSFNAASSSDFEVYAKNIAEAVNARYYVDFAGSPEFTWDGKEHEFVVVVEKQESDAKLLGLLWTPPPPDSGGSLWWLWLLLGLVLVIVIIVILVKRSNKAQPADLGMPVAEVPPPAAPQPQKTIMLGVGGSDDGMPIVGWIVPLTGPQQYQTFKLLQGSTKLGTGGAAHIHVQDGFMSTEHAEIACSPAGFVLKDNGSTNGTFVNQRRVSTHELVDNDVFTLGRTDFKFKSIN